MIYVVKQGDSIDGIAVKTGADVNQLIYDNQLIPPYELAVGQTLFVTSQQQLERREIISNGYAYPFISPYVLRQTLTFLSELSVFSYGFTNTGDIIYPLWDDVWMIEEAKQYNTRPILTLTPFDESGRFNNNLISVIVNDRIVQENLLQQLLQVIERKGYQGVDVDFEYIKAEDRDAFTTFVANLTNRMNMSGYQVSVALAPKTSDEQQGLLYQGKDYGGLGAAANSVLLMTYEYGYTYSEPQAVAPINQVRRVVEYALTKIPAKKISLGIPNYGYDWPLPYVRGMTRAQTIGNIEAVRIAIAQGSAIQFQELSQSPYFRYETGGIDHEVWFEDLRSLQAKFNLVKEFDLRGMGYWQIMQLYRGNWLLLQEQFERV